MQQTHSCRCAPVGAQVLYVPDVYAESPVKGAINAPWGPELKKILKNLPKEKEVMVYCYTGQTAGQAVAGLRVLGYDAVSLKSGMGTGANAPGGWSNQGFSVVK